MRLVGIVKVEPEIQVVLRPARPSPALAYRRPSECLSSGGN